MPEASMSQFEVNVHSLLSRFSGSWGADCEIWLESIDSYVLEAAEREGTTIDK